ncbi:MAG TPA: hypothetical protein VMS14_05555, partial [Ilumatobacteraceae bacterium]|nr:hypothetical protein [Ilumatobacteraceae bacterium]
MTVPNRGRRRIGRGMDPGVRLEMYAQRTMVKRLAADDERRRKADRDGMSFTTPLPAPSAPPRQ